MLGSPAGQAGGGTQRGLWPLAPAPAPSASFTTDGFGKFYSLLPGGPAFGSAIYSHSSIGRFATTGQLQAPPGTSFHTSHKVSDSLFASGYTFGAPTPPPGSPYSPIPVTQLELLTKGFNSNIIIQQQQQQLPEYIQQPMNNKIQIKQQCDSEKTMMCCLKQKKACVCNNNSANKTKFLDSPSGCSRTNPVDWGTVHVKKEPGLLTPCQVAEITTSLNPMIKIEQASPTLKHNDLQLSAMPNNITNGNIPVGIAVARQRIQHEVSSPGLLSTYNSTHIKEISRISEYESGMAASLTAGVPGMSSAGGAGGTTLLHCATDERQYTAWPLQAPPHNPAFAPTPTLWQYPGPLPMDTMVPMSMPPLGYQLVRDHNTGGLLLLPTTGMEQLQQTVVWPSYHQQPQSHLLLPPLPPPPLQLISSASDYLQTSTLHQHTQTHSTRLLAVTTDQKSRKMNLPSIPTTTYIKIETSDASMDQCKTMQTVSSIANNTNTIYTDQSIAPLVTTHVIYQHPNLILSQTPHLNEGVCREQASSPVACLTPPPEISQIEEETRVQDASNQTECQDYEPMPGLCPLSDPKLNEVLIDEPQIESVCMSETLSMGVQTCVDSQSFADEIKIIEGVEAPQVEPQIESEMIDEPPREAEEAHQMISLQPDISGLELLSNSIVEFESHRLVEAKFGGDIKVEDVMPQQSNDEVLTGIAQMKLTDDKIITEELGGLNLLCALAEQRIMEEVNALPMPQITQSPFKMRESILKLKDTPTKSDRKERKKVRRLLKKHKKLNKSSEAAPLQANSVDESDEKLSDTSFKMCTCIDSYKTYKTPQSQEEARKFIRSKSQTMCCPGGEWPCMNANEINIRMNLADLQRKYREKQRELSKLKPKKNELLKKSRKKSVNSDRSTPPPLLDKMDLPVKVNKTQELLKPPTLCAFETVKSAIIPHTNTIKATPKAQLTAKFNLELLASSALIASPNKSEVADTNQLINNNNHNQTPQLSDNDNLKKRHSSPSWTDLSDSSPEKSSKKRKVGRPKKLQHDDCTETETLVSKKPKNLFGYVLAAKEKLLQIQNKQPGVSDTPPRFIDNQITHRDKKHKSKIRPKLKAEPTIKSYIDAEQSDVSIETHEENRVVDVENVDGLSDLSGEDAPKCILTKTHLEVDKLRVLTAMGGLFYAGRLHAVQPPDVYSITLDGERGNRPHIMSREEILRDAIVELSPGSTAEIPPGTRLCAYWSQQYRCLYPGSVAESEESTELDLKFVSVEFDDGDSGRIALEDIRLLPVDYPIIEYDPNPLLSLSKRRRRTSTIDERRLSQTSPTRSVEPTNVQPTKLEKENKDVNKPDDDGHRDRKRLKKRKREKLKQRLAQNDSLKMDKKKRKKHKCNDEHCRHKKHHKKHRKHKKHHHNKDPIEDKKDFGDNLVFPEYHIISNSEGIINGGGAILNEISNDQIVEAPKPSEIIIDEPPIDIIGNSEDEVTMDDILEAKTTKIQNAKLRDRQESCESSRSKMSAFLPARQLWGWAGKWYKRPKGKGRTRKLFYKEIQRGKETIAVGDSAVFLSTGRPDRPYIGRIEAMWENCSTMVVKVKWFYHPEETIGCPLNLKYPGALFESPHVDENDVQTISHKCNVLPLKEYTNKLGDDPRRYATIYDNNDIYYLAGYYDPTSTNLKIETDIPFNNPSND